jgi:hypothetical protein
MDVGSARLEFVDMFFTLREDAAHWVPARLGEDTPFIRRAFVRATFAFIEGTAHAMKQIALAMHEEGEAELSEDDLAFLRTERTQNPSDGKKVRKKLSALDNARSAFDTFARAHRVGVTLRVDGINWQQAKRAVLVRHRLLHPKSSKDLQLSDGEIELVNGAGKWFQDAVFELFSELGAVTRSRILALTHQSLFDPRLRP